MCSVVRMDLFAFSYMESSDLTSTIFEDSVFFPSVYSEFFWKNVLFTMLALLIHQHRRPFHLLISSPILLLRLEVFIVQAFHLLG